MPNIPLNEAFGLNADGSLAPGAKLPAFLSQFAALQNVSLDKVAVQHADLALQFGKPFTLQAGNLSVEIGGEAGGTIRVLRGADLVLDESDPFGNIPVGTNEIYVAVVLSASVNGNLGAGVSSFSFGLSAGKTFELRCYRRFGPAPGGFPTFGRALAETAKALLLPVDANDLAKVDADSVLVLAGTAELKASATFSTGITAEQFAVKSPVGGEPVKINASGSLSTEVDFTLSGSYQVRLRRAPDGADELGIYKAASRELGFQVSASAGLEVNPGQFDLTEKLIGALSQQPIVDVEEFRKGLPGEDALARDLQIRSFEKKLQSAVATKFEASVRAGISQLAAKEAVWQFEIDLPDATSEEAASAITAAFRGDFRPLTGDPMRLPRGIKQTADIVTLTSQSKDTLRLNLLGLVNFYSVSKLASISTIERDATGGVTLLTDSADENELQALVRNSAGNVRRLKHLLTEDFLLQASFKVSNVGVVPPEFMAEHSFFDTFENTSAQQMKDLLDAARAVGLVSTSEVSARIQGRSSFGRTTFFLQARYTSDAAKRIFLDETGNPRAEQDLETMGRLALGALLDGDAGQEFRHRIAEMSPRGNALWQRMKQTGNIASFNELFGVPLDELDPRVAAAGSDYVCITSWAAAVHEAGAAIKAVSQLLQSQTSPADSKLNSARAQLKQRMADVVKHSEQHFGDPLGLVMVFLASGRTAECRVILTGDDVERLDAVSGGMRLTAQARP
jgi:hypothetical protein